MVNRTVGSPDEYKLVAANKIYEEGNNGTQIGFISSSITQIGGLDWDLSSVSYIFASSSIINTKTFTQ